MSIEVKNSFKLCFQKKTTNKVGVIRDKKLSQVYEKINKLSAIQQNLA